MQYVVILEEGPESWGAYVPDLPGCVAVGETRQEVLGLIREAIEFHLDGMKEGGDPIPEPHSHSEVVQVDAAYLFAGLRWPMMGARGVSAVRISFREKRAGSRSCQPFFVGAGHTVFPRQGLIRRSNLRKDRKRYTFYS
jgi:predicted RNase H-like HicB family nuclease